MAGDAIVIAVKDEADARDRSVALLGQEPFVREITSEGDQLRLYVEDGSAALPAVAATPRPRADRRSAP